MYSLPPALVLFVLCGKETMVEVGRKINIEWGDSIGVNNSWGTAVPSYKTSAPAGSACSGTPVRCWLCGGSWLRAGTRARASMQ